MLSKEIVRIIDEYVDEKYFDTEKLKRYLSLHTVVGNEVFNYCDKRNGRDGGITYSGWLDDEWGYQPLDIEGFIKRIPFYFYRYNIENGKIGCLHYLISAVIEKEADVELLEKMYQGLEYLFYDKKLNLDQIFNYLHEQTDVAAEKYFFQWIEYLRLSETLGWDDVMPNKFINKYNEAREACELDPIIYEVQEVFPGGFFHKSGNILVFEGVFPCDDAGKPIMKWIGLKVRNVSEIRASTQKSEPGMLHITATPSTSIHGLNIYNFESQKDDCWYSIYEGPLNMTFDFTILKEKRKQLGFTQQQVADAVGSTIRTYQKWENGETTPDGHYLLRILNWLDIYDIQDCIKYNSIDDTEISRT